MPVNTRTKPAQGRDGTARRAARPSPMTRSATRARDRSRRPACEPLRAERAPAPPRPRASGATKSEQLVDEPGAQERRRERRAALEQQRLHALLREPRAARLERPREELELGALRAAARAEGEPPRLPRGVDVARVEARVVGAHGAHPDRDRVGRARAARARGGGSPRRRPSAIPGDGQPAVERRPPPCRSRTGGRCATQVRHASFWRRARRARSPSASSTSTPRLAKPLRARRRPPPGSDRRRPTTTRATPAARTASAHGGVAAVVRARLERDVERRPARPLAGRLERDDLARAARLAARASPPPRPRRPRTTTAPTIGFGLGRPAAALGELERALEVLGSRDGAGEAAVRRAGCRPRRRSRSRRRSGRRPPRARRATFSAVIAAVHLHEHLVGQRRRAARGCGRATPAGTPGPSSRDGCSCRARGRRPARPRPPPRPRVSGLKATPTPSPCSRASLDRAAPGRRSTSTWKVTLSPPASAICGKCRAGVVDHQMAVDHAAAAWIDRRDRLEHDRPDRDRLDEVPVADVEVEDPHAGVEQLPRSARRGGRSRPRRATARSRRPTHSRQRIAAASCAHSRDEEAGRAVDVRQREQELGPPRVAEAGPFGAEVVRLEAGGVHDVLVLGRVDRADRVRRPCRRAARARPRRASSELAGAPGAARPRQRRSGREARTPSPEQGASTSTRSKPVEVGGKLERIGVDDA